MPNAKPDTKVFVETKAAILNPVNLGDKSYRSFFLENAEAQALWILRAEAREPFRVSWKQGLWSSPPGGGKGHGKHAQSRPTRPAKSGPAKVLKEDA